MYKWLSDTLQGPATVITANRRLARVLRDEYAQLQIKAGRKAWASPAIHSWKDWLEARLLAATEQGGLPTRINSHQSQLLWERCLRKEFDEPRSGLAALVRLSRDTWQRLADWRISINDVARSAQSRDQKLFATVAGRYLAIMQREHWVDDAGLAALIDELLRDGRTSMKGRVTFVGFDRVRPVVTSIIEALDNNGCNVRSLPARPIAAAVGLQSFETADAEMRAAGAWARERLADHPDCTIAIVVGNLEQEAERRAQLLREGLVPGWQYAPPNVARAVNVSYGRKLADFPAISIALLLLQWLVRELSAGEVGHLLRTPLLGTTSTAGRSRLELRLRELPDRGWSPAMLTAALRGRDENPDALQWLSMVASITKQRRELVASASPAEWAVYIDESLKSWQWLGSGGLSSVDFQLVNRWRELLNDLARLELVSPVMTLKTAIRRIELMASETVFQPESEGYAVQLMGPLEASGAEFDAIWIAGVSASHWPPAGNPSPLLSRQLQRQHSMPDANPDDTVAYAKSLLMHLGSSASEVICSYPLTEDDAEQTPSDLLKGLCAATQPPHPDPGWHATTLSQAGCTVVAEDTVPKVLPGERVAGGAGTIQRQLADPFSAFVAGRLGVKYLSPQAIGLPPALRGNIIHDALCRLYADTPSRNDILGWTDEELSARTEQSLNSAFARHERNTDAVLAELFKLERRRMSGLLRNFVGIDREREDFSIAFVEHEVEFAAANVRLQLRVDRIDRLPDDTLAI
ncbi:MAG: hypothetical protein GY949_18710, partial [Gammaproteobacteria bacterium]|nr:hypothetical protein [Gammaproteobacteria bacterium]